MCQKLWTCFQENAQKAKSGMQYSRRGADPATPQDSLQDPMGSVPSSLRCHFLPPSLSPGFHDAPTLVPASGPLHLPVPSAWSSFPPIPSDSHSSAQQGLSEHRVGPLCPVILPYFLHRICHCSPLEHQPHESRRDPGGLVHSCDSSAWDSSLHTIGVSSVLAEWM